jgi:dephospho-CoA kinase
MGALKLVGLTGGIGSGKSTVADIIRAAGIPVLDADVIARQVVEPGQPAHAEIARAWPEVLASDGGIDRKMLGARVFADAQARKRLETITHPRIMAEVAVQSERLAADGHKLAFLEAALLVETGIFAKLDGLVVVAADEETQVARVLARDGCSRDAALVRIRAQLPLSEKTRVANQVIDNNGSLEATREQTLRIVRVFAA